jgi:Tol biopolymer transport system component
MKFCGLRRTSPLTVSTIVLAMAIAMLCTSARPIRAQAVPAPRIFNPSWTPDGRLIYESEVDGRYGVWLAAMNGQGPPRRFLDVTYEVQQPAISPDGRRIAFVVNVAEGNNDIFVADIDGSGRFNVTNAPGSQYLPRWSPDGARIAYVTSKPGESLRGVGVSDVATRKLTVTVQLPGHSAGNLAWAPGKEIIIVGSADDENNVFIVRESGPTAVQLTRGLTAGSPSWSPGGRITIISRHEGEPRVYVMDADGKNLQKLFADGLPRLSPLWSPDGKRIAYIVSVDRRDQLFVANADGSAPLCVAGACPR